MNRVVRFTLAAGAAALVCACSSDSLNPPIGRPLASFSDGAHRGNPDFFFLPPIFKDPSSDPNFTPGAFNAGVRPTVEICRLIADACGATIKSFAAADIQLDATNEQYQVNWDTKASGLVLTDFYRIRVFLGPNTELGHVDIDPVATGAGLKRVDTGEFIGLVDGRTLPIKFRIESGAACNGGACNSTTIDPTQGGFVVLTTTGDRVDIPAQSSGDPITVTVQQCGGLDVDIPVFGNCMRVTTDPPLGETRLSPPATVSICSLDETTLPLTHAQSELVTLHRQDASVDGNVVVALPHSTDFCQGTIGRSEHTGPQTLAGRTWRAIRDAAHWVFQPATLHARTMVLDVGAGGQTDGFSDFQLALPAKMEILSLADQTTTPNTAVPSIPAVLVTDADGNAVANARVRFQITSSGGGSFLPPSPVMTDATGHATLTSWVVGALGQHTLQAYGFGIADPGNHGPGRSFIPFAPAVLHNPGDDENQSPVFLGTGHLTFAGTAATPVTLVECLGNPGGDDITRGFYVPAFSGTGLRGVTMSFSSRTAGTYTLHLTARAATYDGTVLDTARTSVTLTADDQANVPATFVFNNVPVAAGSTVAFSLAIVDGPSTVVFYSVPSQGDPNCPVVQTNGTTPPLDSFRRQGVGILITGFAPPIP